MLLGFKLFFFLISLKGQDDPWLYYVNVCLLTTRPTELILKTSKGSTDKSVLINYHIAVAITCHI